MGITGIVDYVIAGNEYVSSDKESSSQSSCAHPSRHLSLPNNVANNMAHLVNDFMEWAFLSFQTTSRRYHIQPQFCVCAILAEGGGSDPVPVKGTDGL